MMHVFEAIPALLGRAGIDVVFGLIGGSNAAWVAQGLRCGTLRYVRTRHEATSVSAACAYSRATGDLGIATVTMGPGFANTVNAMIAAVRDNIPLVLITGSSPSGKSHGLQDIDQRGLVNTIGAGFHDIRSADKLESAFTAAVLAARWNGTPQVLCVGEILGDPIELSDSDGSDCLPPVAEPDHDAVAAAIDVLAQAEHPLVLAGWGATRANCRDSLVELAGLAGARVASTLNANRFFAGHPHDLGVCGNSSPARILEELGRTDVVLAVGASLNPFTTGDGGLFPAARIIQCEIDADRDFRASAPELGLLGDANASVRALIEEWRHRGLPNREVRATTPTFGEIQTSVLNVDLGHDPARGLDLRQVYTTLDRALPSDRVVVTDGGRAGHSLPTLVNARDARSWLPSRGHGSIGLGMGAAIGAAAAAPGRRVALFCGDSAFMMAAQELDAIRLNGLDITITVMNDQQAGAELKYLRRFDLPLDVARQSMPDIPLLARAYGGTSVVLESEEDLANLQLPGSGLTVIEARIDPEVDGKAIFA